jgi:putative colanic acid biosynthesis UDP-glucose lipid carrier transferase
MTSSGFYGGSLRFHATDFARIHRISDPLVITSIFVFLDIPATSFTSFMPPWLWVLLVSALFLPFSSIYSSYRLKSLFTLFRRVTTGWLIVLTILLIVLFFTKTTASFSRSSITLWATLCWFYLLLSHVGLRTLLRWHRSHGGNKRTIIYWGTVDAASSFASQLDKNPWLGFSLLAWFSPIPPPPNSQPSNLPNCSGGISDMRRWLERYSPDRIVFSHVTRDGINMDQVLRLFGDTSTPVIYAPHWAHPAMRFTVDTIGDQQCIELWGSERSIFDRQTKRIFDLLFSSVAIILASPVLIIVSLLVILSGPGPILFAQDRYGLDSKRFRIYKFRTMNVVEAGDKPFLKQASRDDPRITNVGRFLRRWSLDELPQLFNVLKGEMSLVGPRPHAVDHNEQYRKLIPGYMQRHAFKPGITGLAQVEGWRGETKTLEDMSRRIDADLRYQKEWSLKLDIKILIKTIIRLKSKNAY